MLTQYATLSQMTQRLPMLRTQPMQTIAYLLRVDVLKPKENMFPYTLRLIRLFTKSQSVQISVYGNVENQS